MPHEVKKQLLEFDDLRPDASPVIPPPVRIEL